MGFSHCYHYNMCLQRHFGFVLCFLFMIGGFRHCGWERACFFLPCRAGRLGRYEASSLARARAYTERRAKTVPPSTISMFRTSKLFSVLPMGRLMSINLIIYAFVGLERVLLLFESFLISYQLCLIDVSTNRTLLHSQRKPFFKFIA